MAASFDSYYLLTFGDYLGLIPCTLIVCCPIPDSFYNDVHLLVIKSDSFEIPIFDHFHTDSVDSATCIYFNWDLNRVIDCILLLHPKRICTVFEPKLDTRKVFSLTLLFVKNWRKFRKLSSSLKLLIFLKIWVYLVVRKFQFPNNTGLTNFSQKKWDVVQTMLVAKFLALEAYNVLVSWNLLCWPPVVITFSQFHKNLLDYCITIIIH